MISVTICSPDPGLAAAWDDLIRARVVERVHESGGACTPPATPVSPDVHMLLAWQTGVEPRRLVGVWALQQRKIAPLWPALLEALPYNYAFLSSPVVDPAFASPR